MPGSHSGKHSRCRRYGSNPLVIADGIVAMEGNGPLNGTSRPFGKIVLADDSVATDSTCVRLMGLDPGRIVHVRERAKFIGNTAA